MCEFCATADAIRVVGASMSAVNIALVEIKTAFYSATLAAQKFAAAYANYRAPWYYRLWWYLTDQYFDFMERMTT